MHPSSYNKDNSCPNFWQMIWETKAKLIAMLCEITPGFSGCSEYFPISQDQSVQHGNFLIKTISKIDKDALCHRVFEVSNTSNGSMHL